MFHINNSTSICTLSHVTIFLKRIRIIYDNPRRKQDVFDPAARLNLAFRQAQSAPRHLLISGETKHFLS